MNLKEFVICLGNPEIAGLLENEVAVKMSGAVRVVILIAQLAAVFWLLATIPLP